MKGVLIILALLPTTIQAQEYQIEQRCRGNRGYAMVVEYKNQYHVVETPVYFQHNWTIGSLNGIRSGGYHTLYYIDGDGFKDHMEVNILSRGRWNYSGSAGAKAMCRRITQSSFGHY